MARKLRIEYEGAIYHVTCRMLGDSHSKLFVDIADRKRFLNSLSDRVEQYNIRLYMYVLMSNHFHLVFETPAGNCSKFMQSLSTSFTVYYNLRHNRHGHLLDGRYKAKLVDGDDYLLALSRYVHLNPVKILSMQVKSIEERLNYLHKYQWSSYLGYIDKRQQLEFVDYAPVLSEMPGKRGAWTKNYQKFVDSGIATNDNDFRAALKESSIAVGGDEFIKLMKGKYEEMLDDHNCLEDVSFRNTSLYLGSDMILSVIATEFNITIQEFAMRKRKSPLKAIAAKYLMKYAGKNQREVAGFLGVASGAAVNGQISRYKEQLSTDKKLIKSLRRVEKCLDEKNRDNEKR